MQGQFLALTRPVVISAANQQLAPEKWWEREKEVSMIM